MDIKRIFEVAFKKRIPLVGYWEVTSRCNFKCSHCYIKDYKMPGEELQMEDIKKIFKEIKKAGCLWLVLTGGEPLLREDFLEVYNFLFAQGFFLVIYTNGSILNEKIIKRFSQFPPFEIAVTLYGASEKTYEKVTRVKGMYKKVISNIETFKNQGIKIHIRTLVTKDNKNDLKKMKKIAKNFGVSLKYDPLVLKSLNGKRDLEKKRLSPEEIVKLDLDDKERKDAWIELFEHMMRGKFSKNNKLFKCSAGRFVFHMDPWGNVFPCIFTRFVSFNVKTLSFKKGWKDVLSIWLDVPDFSECKRCSLRYACPACPGWAWVEKRDSFAKIPYLCKVTEERSKKFKGGG